MMTGSTQNRNHYNNGNNINTKNTNNIQNKNTQNNNNKSSSPHEVRPGQFFETSSPFFRAVNFELFMPFDRRIALSGSFLALFILAHFVKEGIQRDSIENIDKCNNSDVNTKDNYMNEENRNT